MPILQKQAAEEHLAPHRGRLYKCVRRAWARWQAESEHLQQPTPSQRAQFVHAYLRDEVLREFRELDTMEPDGRFLLLINQHLHLRFKKLTDGLPRNYPTQGALEFEMQPELPSMDEFAVGTVGYGLNRLGELSYVCVKCLNGKREIWNIELEEEKATVLSLPFKQKTGSRQKKDKLVKGKKTGEKETRLKANKPANDNE